MFARYNKVGLSIAELLVATGLLATVLVTVMTLFGQLLKNTNKNSLLSAGAYFADSVLEKQILSAEDRLSLAASNAVDAFPDLIIEGEGRVATADDDIDKQTRYLYKVDLERLDSNPSDGNGQMWMIDIEVRWWMDDMLGDAKRQGTGKLFLKRSRVTYIERPI